MNRLREHTRVSIALPRGMQAVRTDSMGLNGAPVRLLAKPVEPAALVAAVAEAIAGRESVAAQAK